MTHAYSGIYAGRFIKTEAECHTYEEYRAWLGSCWIRIIASNVVVRWEHRYDVVEVILYHTPILRFTPHDTFSAYSGGYETMTTVTRMQQFGPKGVGFWRYKGKVVCSRGPCVEGVYYPIKLPEPVVPETPIPSVRFDPLARRKRTIRRVRFADG